MTKLQKIVYLHFKKVYHRNPFVAKGQLPTYLYNYKIYVGIKAAQLESRRTGIEYMVTQR
jgi:hypothetical protein